MKSIWHPGTLLQTKKSLFLTAHVFRPYLENPYPFSDLALRQKLWHHFIFKYRVIAPFTKRGHNVFNCMCGRNAPFLDRALSQFRLGVHLWFLILFLRGSKASEMAILNVSEVTREGRICDFSPPPIVLPFSWGGVGALFTGARVFARSYGQK